jgi:hypothetical protein
MISLVEASYRVAKQFRHTAHWARVTMSLETAPQDDVTVADDAFAWRRFPPGPDGDGMRSEAIEGVRYALDRLPSGRPQYRVTVTKIEDSPTDTGRHDIKLAAAQATWAALGFTPAEPPWIADDGPAFPS